MSKLQLTGYYFAAAWSIVQYVGTKDLIWREPNIFQIPKLNYIFFSQDFWV